MAESKKVGINFRTTADTRGAKAAAKAIESVNKAAEKSNKSTSDTAAKSTEKIAREVEKLNKVADLASKTHKELDKELNKVEGASEELTDALKKQSKELGDISNKSKKTADKFRNLDASSGKLEKGQKTLAKSGNNTGLAFLEVSRAVEDAQYGLRGVLNNIPQIITLFGGTAGLAAVVSISAVAFAQLSGQMAYSKKETEGFGDTLKDLTESALKEFNDSIAREEDHKSFRENVDTDIESLSKLEDKLALIMSQRKAIRKLDAEDKIKDLELELLRVDGDKSLTTEEQKELKRSNIRQQMSAVRGGVTRQDLDEEIEHLRSVESARRALLELNEQELKQVRIRAKYARDPEQVRDSAENAAYMAREAVKALGGDSFKMPDEQNIFRRNVGAGHGLGARRQFSAQFNPVALAELKKVEERSEANVKRYNKGLSLIKTSEVTEEDPASVRSYKARLEKKGLEDVKAAGEQVRALKESGEELTQFEKKVIEAGEHASIALDNLTKSAELAVEAERVKVSNENLAAKAVRLRDENQGIRSGLPELAARSAVLDRERQLIISNRARDAEKVSIEESAKVQTAAARDAQRAAAEAKKAEIEQARANKQAGIESPSKQILKAGKKAQGIAKGLGANESYMGQLDAAVAMLEDGVTNPEAEKLNTMIGRMVAALKAKGEKDSADAIRLRQLIQQVENLTKYTKQNAK